MADQFVVPQFLDVEAKIIGPITGRQFVLLLFMALGDFIIYRVFLSVIGLVAIALPFSLIVLAFAFAKVNGQPLHYIALNILQTFRRPLLRVWDKSLTDKEVRAGLKKEVEPVPLPSPVKVGITSSRLSELTLIVNTGGSYSPEDEEITAGIKRTPVQIEKPEK